MKTTKLSTGIVTVQKGTKVDVYSQKEWEQKEAQRVANNVTGAMMLVFGMISILFMLLGITSNQLN